MELSIISKRCADDLCKFSGLEVNSNKSSGSRKGTFYSCELQFITSPDDKTFIHALKKCFLGFPGGAVVKNLPANAGDTGSSPGLGRSHMLRSN